MREIFFVFKTFVATLVLVFILQIKLGDDTLEMKALAGLRQSTFATSLQEFGNDGWAAFRNLASKASHSLGSFFSRNEDRASIFKLKRSEAYKQEVEGKLEKIENAEKDQFKKLAPSKKQ